MEDRYLFKAKAAQIVGTYNNFIEDGVWVYGSLRCDVGNIPFFSLKTKELIMSNMRLTHPQSANAQA